MMFPRPSKSSFLALGYVGVLLGCFAVLIFWNPNGVELSASAGSVANRLFEPSAEPTTWTQHLHLPDEAAIQVEGVDGLYDLRFDIHSADFQANKTTLHLSLNQTLVVTPNLSVLFDENRQAVAVALNQEDKILSESQMAVSIAHLLNSFLSPGKEQTATNSTEASNRRQLGMKKHGHTASMRAPGFNPYPFPFPYPYPYPSTSPGLYTRPPPPQTFPAQRPRPYIQPQPIILPQTYQPQQLIRPQAIQPVQVLPAQPQLLLQPQQLQLLPQQLPQQFVQQQLVPQQVRPVAPLAPLGPLGPLGPVGANGMTAGDLELIAELIRSTNTQLKEEILDLTIDPADVNERPNIDAITGDTLISMDALNILSNAINGRKSETTATAGTAHEQILDLNFNPEAADIAPDRRPDRSTYLTGFNDGFRDGYGRGVETGETLTTSLWCSIDKAHPLCGAVGGRRDDGLELLAGSRFGGSSARGGSV